MPGDKAPMLWTLAGLSLFFIILASGIAPETAVPEFGQPAVGPALPPAAPAAAAVAEARALTDRLLALPPGAPLTPELTLDAAQRKQLLLRLIEENPQEALNLLIPRTARARLPPAIQPDVEEEVELEGELEVLHIDSDDPVGHPERSMYLHFLDIAGEKVSLHSDVPIVQLMPVISGSVVHVSGFKLEDKLLSQGVQQNFQVLLGEEAHASEQKTIVILGNFIDKNLTMTPQQAKDTVFGTVNNFYLEASYGDTFFTGPVVGPFNLNLNSSADLGSIRSASIAAADPVVDFTQYSRIVLFHPATYCGWGSVGKSSLQTADGPIKASTSWQSDKGDDVYCRSPLVVSHELGHNLGLFHANRLDCSASFSDVGPAGCNSTEYGDPFDVMGTGIFFNGTTYLPFHMNAYHKRKLGWVSDGTPTITTYSGIYSIEPIETPPLVTGGSGIKVVRIPYDNGFYHIEYRQPIGFDRNMTGTVRNLRAGVYGGALLHIAPQFIPSDKGGSDSNLIDASASDSLALQVGETYVDSIKGINITVLGVDAGTRALKVKITPNVSEIKDVAAELSVPSTLFLNATTKVSVVLSNFGNVKAENINVTLRAVRAEEITVSETIGSIIVRSLAAGGSTTVSFSWTPSLRGVHQLEAMAEVANDFNPANNDVLRIVNVVPNAPDISVGVGFTIQEVFVNTSTNVTVFLENSGGADAKNLRVLLRDETTNEMIGNAALALLWPGQSTSIIIPWRPTVAGYHFISATAQVANEFDPADNTALARVTVPGPGFCADSDGGTVLAVKGDTTGKSVFPDEGITTKTDYCIQKNADGTFKLDQSLRDAYSVAKVRSCETNCAVMEYFCAQTGFIVANVATCTNGCTDGACTILR